MKKYEMSTRAKVILRRTYNRPLNKEGTIFESWEDTLDRVINHQKWLWERALGGKALNKAQLEELAELRQLMVECKVFPAGRTLWLGGTEVSRTRESSMFNCLEKNSKVLTLEFGSVPIKDLVGLDFHVLNADSEWVPATCKSGGVQRLYDISFHNRGTQKLNARATLGHRWWLTDGRRVTTGELSKKDIIPFVRAPDSQPFNSNAFLHGLVYADGTTVNNGTGSIHFRIRLCGEKSEYLDIFEGYKVSYPPSFKGDPLVHLGNVMNWEVNLKELPEITDPEYIASFLKGVIAGDGDLDGNGISGTLETCEYVKRYSHLIGITALDYKELPSKTNYGPRTKPCFRLKFKTGDQDYYFTGIEYTGIDEEVFCCEVPGSESFTLEKGLLTSNCAFCNVETVYDLVDVLWLLLQGCGVGFSPIIGTLTGFRRRIPEIEVIRSTATEKTGNDENEEIWDVDRRVWTIKVGDSAEAWAKALGKLVAGKYPADKLTLDFSNIRPAGERLKGYGWLSSGDEQICIGFRAIAEILNSRTDQLLTKMNILDIVNWLGTILSSRRSAQIALFEYGAPEWKDFAVAKKNWWETNNSQRQQSNNSLAFKYQPTRRELEELFEMMQEAGGSEPGFINMGASLKRAPWFSGVNPCAEILLSNKSFCNLVETDVGKFKNNQTALFRAIYLSARMNYRQTCVDLRDGVLQEAWHLNNDFLRLCGVGLTGIARRPDLQGYDYTALQRTATYGAYSMAIELDMPMPKNVTTVKPSGTISKVMDTPEGVHTPLGKYIFNNIQFNKNDPLVKILEDAGYNVFNHPTDETGVLVTFPVKWDNVSFHIDDGKEVNLETAVTQLDRYKMLQDHWCQQNTSCTVSYSPDEIPQIIDWLEHNWDSYVGVSFLYRADPTKTAKDLGYLYLPQEVVTKEEFDEYCSKLGEIDLDAANSFEELIEEGCATGACPIK